MSNKYNITNQFLADNIKAAAAMDKTLRDIAEVVKVGKIQIVHDSVMLSNLTDEEHSQVMSILGLGEKRENRQVKNPIGG